MIEPRRDSAGSGDLAREGAGPPPWFACLIVGLTTAILNAAFFAMANANLTLLIQVILTGTLLTVYVGLLRHDWREETAPFDALVLLELLELKKRNVRKL